MGNLNIVLVTAVSLTILRFANGVTHDYRSEVHAVPQGFTTAVASWNVRTHGTSWIETLLRARIGDRWTNWYAMGRWSRNLTEGNRQSVNASADADGHVDTDTLTLKSAANAWQARVLFHNAGRVDSTAPGDAAATLSLLAVTTGNDVVARSHSRPDQKRAWGIDIDVPERTQHVDESPDALGGGGEAWCSPTSVSMIMAFWAARMRQPLWDTNVIAAARGTFDPAYKGCGNWPFNVAYASEHGLEGWVQRLASLADMERYIAQDIPLVASIRVAPGELDGSPYKKTDGHLLVVRGFTSAGDIIANDPAALPGHIRIVYKRAQFEHVWMNGSHGIVYVIGPPDLLKHIGK